MSIAYFQPGQPPEPHYRRPKRHRPSIRVAPLNITSFMDLTFNLLLFFVLTASFSGAEGVIGAKMPLPSQGRGPAGVSARPGELPKTPQQIKVRIGAAGQELFRINIDGVAQTPGDFKELKQLLESLQHDPKLNRDGPFDPDTPVLIIPEGAVRWDYVVSAFNAAVAARYSDIGFAQAQAR